MADKLDFLVIGAGRGGTSLLTTCLDAHPKIGAGLELFAKEFLHGLAIEDHRLRFDMRYRVSSFFAACEQQAHKTVRPIFGNKILAENIYKLQDCLSALQQNPTVHVKYFFEQVPETVKIVFIVRDGRNLMASKVKRTQQLLSHALFRYKYFMFVLRYLNENYRPLLVVRFEDLISDPEKVLRSVCEFIGVDFSPVMLTTEGKTMPSYYEKPYFDKSKAETTNTIPDMYFPLIKDDLEYCGYT